MFNANNYGYNPYGRYMPQQPQQELFNSVQSRPVLSGKVVDSLDVVKATDIPLDGTISYFPLTDGSAIITKKLQMDGTSKTVIYKPVEEEKVPEIKYITSEQFDSVLDDIKTIKKDIKKLNKKESEEDV